MAILRKNTGFQYIGGNPGAAYIPGHAAYPQMPCSGYVVGIPWMPGPRNIGSFFVDQADVGFWRFIDLGTSDVPKVHRLSEHPVSIDVVDPRTGKQVVALALAVLHRAGANIDAEFSAELSRRNRLSQADAAKAASRIGYDFLSRNAAAMDVYAIGVRLPAVPSAPAVAAVSPTPSQMVKLTNSGWNSTSRSRSPLDKGAFYSHSVVQNSRATFVGIGTKGLDMLPIGAYPVGVLSDADGTYAVEYGVKKALLQGILSAASQVRVFKDTSNRVHCMVTGGGSYRSSIVNGDVYIYTKMYTGDDTLTGFGLSSGAIQYGSV
jgi:hypothetical protein